MNEFSDFIENSEEITQDEFLEQCEIDEDLLENIKEFPNDYNYFKNGNIYFYTHSRIEHFFKTMELIK